MKTHIAINGAGGRMGRRLVALANEDHTLRVVALEAATNPGQSRDAGQIAGIGPVTDDPAPALRPDCVVDCSAPDGTMTILPICVARQIPIVIATTGHTAAQKAEIEAAAHQ